MTFEELLTMTKMEVPFITVRGSDKLLYEWVKTHWDEPFESLFEVLGSAIQSVAQQEGRSVSYRVEDLDPVKLRREFQRRLLVVLGMLDLGYSVEAFATMRQWLKEYAGSERVC